MATSTITGLACLAIYIYYSSDSCEIKTGHVVIG